MAESYKPKLGRLRHVEAFHAVIETGSISKAAARLGISQPAMSKIILKFETAIGTPLFVRRKGAIFPTEYALHLFEDVTELLELIRRLEGVFERGSSSGPINLRFTGTLTVVTELVPDLFARLHAKLPDCEFQISSLAIEDMSDALLQNTADFALHTRPLDHPKLDSHLVAESPQVCVLRKDHPLAEYEKIDVGQLDGQNLILPPRKDPSYSYFRTVFNEQRVFPKIRVISPFSGVSAEIVQRMNVLSVNNKMVATRKCRANPLLTYRVIDGIDQSTSFFLTNTKVLRRSETTETVLSCLRALFPQDQAST